MTKLQCTVVLALAGMISSCYESREPLGKPGKHQLDRRLAGDWLCKAPVADDKPSEAHLWIIPFDDLQYYAEWRDGDDVTRYRAYPTVVDGEVLLNINELSFRVSSLKWVFMRYRLEGDNSLRLSIVSKNAIGDLEDTAALKAIRRRAKQDGLYESFATCGREL